VGKAIDISRRKDEAAAKLKGIRAEFVLMMSRSAGPIAALDIIAANEVQQIRGSQVGDRISLALFVNQQREFDPRFFAENSRIVAVPKADGSDGSAFVPEGLLVFAQLRDVLAAKNSAIVAEKNDDGGFALPQRPQADLLAVSVGKNDLCEPLAQSSLHAKSSFTSRHPSVNAASSLIPAERAIRTWRPTVPRRRRYLAACAIASQLVLYRRFTLRTVAKCVPAGPFP
jgi:hypothetical protein